MLCEHVRVCENAYALAWAQSYMNRNCDQTPGLVLKMQYHYVINVCEMVP